MTELQTAIRERLDASGVPQKPADRIMAEIGKQERLADLRRDISCLRHGECECDRDERERVCCYWANDRRTRD